MALACMGDFAGLGTVAYTRDYPPPYGVGGLGAPGQQADQSRMNLWNQSVRVQNTPPATNGANAPQSRPIDPRAGSVASKTGGTGSSRGRAGGASAPARRDSGGSGWSTTTKVVVAVGVGALIYYVHRELQRHRSFRPVPGSRRLRTA